MATDMETQAKMVMLTGLDYDRAEVADELGVSESTVSKYVNQHEEAARNADDWEAYYWEVVTAAVYNDEFREILAGFLTDTDGQT